MKTQFKDAQKFECPVCFHKLHGFESEILEEHGAWRLVETVCRHCGSSSLGLVIGKGKNFKQVKLLSDIPWPKNFKRELKEDYYNAFPEKDYQWTES